MVVNFRTCRISQDTRKLTRREGGGGGEMGAQQAKIFTM